MMEKKLSLTCGQRGQCGGGGIMKATTRSPLARHCPRAPPGIAHPSPQSHLKRTLRLIFGNLQSHPAVQTSQQESPPIQ